MYQAFKNVCRTIIEFFILSQLLQISICLEYNLQGKPGDGYYIAVDIGIPQQKVIHH